MRFVARRCSNPSCGLRFPVDADSGLGTNCPLCASPTQVVSDRYDTPSACAPKHQEPARRIPLYGILDNVRSLRNVGAIFRCSDGAAVDHLYLCGFTPTPKHPKLDKTALGAQHRVPWTHRASSLELIDELASQGVALWAVEGGADAISIFDASTKLDPGKAPAVALVFGHEVSGVDPQILERCDARVQIPMLGIKASLNVSVAFGIVAFTLRYA